MGKSGKDEGWLMSYSSREAWGDSFPTQWKHMFPLDDD